MCAGKLSLGLEQAVALPCVSWLGLLFVHEWPTTATNHGRTVIHYLLGPLA